MASKPTGKFSDDASAQTVSFKSAVATVDDELRERLERAKRETESQLRNMAGMLIFQFEESGDNEWIFSKLPDFMADMKVEHGKAKGNDITLKSLYSAVNAHIKAQNGNNPVKAVWSEKAQALAIVRTDRDGEFEPTLKPRTRKTKDEVAAEKEAAAAEGSENTEPDADGEDAASE
jgi:hypothetical protein